MSKQKKLDTIREKMLQDDSLPLKKQATKLVFGEGNPDSEIMFIGEGPGYWEDQKGLPFVGNAGALLNHLLRSIDLDREDVFITNVVHYRPPNNRDPLPEELAAFGVYLDKIIETINPKVIATLGRYSMGKFIPGVMISRVHGKIHNLNWKGKDIVVVPMYHPAAGLRRNEIKKHLFEDFKRIAQALEQSVEKIEKKQDSKKEQMSLI